MISIQIYYLIISGFVIGLLWGWLRLARVARNAEPESAPATRTLLSLSLLSTLSALLCVELWLNATDIHTDFFGFTRAAQRWWDLHWYPVNKFGYRDREYTSDSLQGRDIVFLLGDSIIAGHGIDHAQERIGPQLEHLLGEPWRVLSIAKCGWSTADEQTALELQLKEYAPKVVVLGYYMNDIEGATDKGAVTQDQIKALAPFSDSFLVQNSALINLLYWRLFRSINSDIGAHYWEGLLRSVQDDAVVQKHHAQVKKLITTTRAHGAQVIVVLFPYLFSPGADATFLDPIKAVAVQSGASVIDLRETLQGEDLHEFVVSNSDHHPNAQLHRIAAEAVGKEITKSAPH